VHGAFRVPALARGIVKAVCSEEQDVEEEVDRPKTRAGREVAWSEAELKTAQLVRQLQASRSGRSASEVADAIEVEVEPAEGHFPSRPIRGGVGGGRTQQQRKKSALRTEVMVVGEDSGSEIGEDEIEEDIEEDIPEDL
jgi:hypothetical protein